MRWASEGPYDRLDAARASSSVVDHPDTEARMATRPSHTVGPHQHVPSDCTAAIRREVAASSVARLVAALRREVAGD